MLQKLDTAKPCFDRSHEDREDIETQSSHSTSVTITSSMCQSSDTGSDVDTRLLACMQEISSEIEQIKCQLHKTQKCLTNICETSKTIAASSDETDIKFDEIMKLFDDFEKRVSRNCADICACQKRIEDNVHRIDTAYDEIETLFKTKGDKDEIAKCLAKKANKCELELKVDVEIFDHVKSELSDAILDSHYRIKALSNELDSRVKQISQCLNTKIDREAFSTFARCIEDRIKLISAETKKWINVKKREVCPFTTTPYTSNLQCGACKQPVVMKGIEPNVPLMPSLSQITWNCHAKALTCERTGGRHTITTAQERCPKQRQFYQHFGGPGFDIAQECQPSHHELNFPKMCYDAENEQFNACNGNEE